MAGTRYAVNGDVSLAYEVTGDGEIDLVFVTGFTGHLEVFMEDPAVARFMRRLASFSRLIRYDKRDQGLSDRLGRPPTLEESMDDLRAVMDAAGSERAALLGVSEGGPMCQLFAATYPERTQALVLYGTYARLLSAPDFDIGVDEALFDRFTEMLRREWGGPVALPMFAPSMAGDAAFAGWWAKLLRSSTSPRGAAELMDLYRQIDTRAILPAIRVPTLILHRSGDIAAPVAHARYLAEHIPGARYVELPGVDHIPSVGDQDAILGEIEEFLTGVRHEREPERVLATVLFTDIVGSTERAAELGDRRWRDLLARHDELVRRQVERHRGRVVKNIGDGVLATFDGPARAIDAARTVRDAVRELGIEVRAGLHTGECEAIGDDVGGVAVHIGARVSAQAATGEVLVSSTVKDLVFGSGLEFEDRGEVELKGVPGTWRLYAVADE
jgi:class 3 adenylate cyclase